MMMLIRFKSIWLVEFDLILILIDWWCDLILIRFWYDLTLAHCFLFFDHCLCRKQKLMTVISVRARSVRSNLNLVCEHLGHIGYSVSAHKLKASEYGVPQRRCRFYLVCFLRDSDSSIFAEPMDTIHQKIEQRLEWLKCTSKLPARHSAFSQGHCHNTAGQAGSQK